MTPLIPSIRNPLDDMIRRQALLNHPCEFFRSFFGGRVPTIEQKVAWVEASMQCSTPLQVWENDIYFVRVFRSPPFVHLDITRRDEQPCRDWRHFQQIKNQLVGSNHEAVELYPAECRLVDTANEYHLWIHTDAGYRFPFGFEDRFVLSEPIRIETGPTGAVRTNVTTTVPVDTFAANARPAVTTSARR